MRWIEQLLDTYGKLRLAGEAKDLEDNRKLLAVDRAVVEAHHRRQLGEDFQPPTSRAGENDMIHIGDHHQHLPAPAPAMGRLWKAALAAGLLATGAGGGVGLMVLADVLRPMSRAPDPPVVTPILPSDQDTLFELRLGPPRQ